MYAAINASTNGDNTLVTGIPGRRIVVTGLYMLAQGTVTGQFFSGASANNVVLTGPLAMVAQSTVNPSPVPPQLGTPNGHFTTNQGDNLVLKLGAGVVVGGWLTYEAIN